MFHNESTSQYIQLKTISTVALEEKVKTRRNTKKRRKR
jgi:hypothetical protein